MGSVRGVGREEIVKVAPCRRECIGGAYVGFHIRVGFDSGTQFGSSSGRRHFCC